MKRLTVAVAQIAPVLLDRESTLHRVHEAMREAAAAARFLWQDAARQYLQQLYGGGS